MKDKKATDFRVQWRTTNKELKDRFMTLAEDTERSWCKTIDLAIRNYLEMKGR